MIEVTVESIRVNLVTQNRVVFLKEIDGPRHLPIWIGDFEAQAIAMRLQDVPSPRPLPYQVWKTTIEELGAKVERAVIKGLRADVFYARVILSQGEKIVDLDVRPSDAVAICVYGSAPLFVEDDVLAAAGVNLDDEPIEPGDLENETSGTGVP